MGNVRYYTFQCCDGLRCKCVMGFRYGHHCDHSGSRGCEL